MAIMKAFKPVNTNHLSELALFSNLSSGNFSQQTAHSFKVTKGGITFNVSGSALTYAGGAPDSGQIDQIIVTAAGATLYSLSALVGGNSASGSRHMFGATRSIAACGPHDP